MESTYYDKSSIPIEARGDFIANRLCESVGGSKSTDPRGEELANDGEGPRYSIQLVMAPNSLCTVVNKTSASTTPHKNKQKFKLHVFF